MENSSARSRWRRRLFPLRGTDTTVDAAAEGEALESSSHASTQSPIEDSIPRGVRIAGAWSWRILLIAAVIALVIFLIAQLRYIVIPVLIAVLVSSLLVPFVKFLVRHRWPKGIAVTLSMLVAIGVVTGLLWVAIRQIATGFSDVRDRTVESFDGFKEWLLASPLHVTDQQINDLIAQGVEFIQRDGGVLVSGAMSVGSTLGHVIAGLFLALFSLLFILIDGRGIWNWVVNLFPRKARLAIDGAGQAGWTTLSNYARTQILVATIDAVGIGAGALILGVPLAIPIAVLVFLGAFIPIVGAVLTGAIAVFVALVYNGWVVALIMLGIVLLVQQVEGHVLQPLLMGTAVKVHPLAIVLVVAAGTMLAGIPGALFAVPIAAVLNVMFRYISSGAWRSRGSGGPPPLGDVIWQTVPAQKIRRRKAVEQVPASSTTEEPSGT